MAKFIRERVEDAIAVRLEQDEDGVTIFLGDWMMARLSNADGKLHLASDIEIDDETPGLALDSTGRVVVVKD